jgi:hypothetical protein
MDLELTVADSAHPRHALVYPFIGAHFVKGLESSVEFIGSLRRVELIAVGG